MQGAPRPTCTRHMDDSKASRYHMDASRGMNQRRTSDGNGERHDVVHELIISQCGRIGHWDYEWATLRARQGPIHTKHDASIHAAKRRLQHAHQPGSSRACAAECRSETMRTFRLIPFAAHGNVNRLNSIGVERRVEESNEAVKLAAQRYVK